MKKIKLTPQNKNEAKPVKMTLREKRLFHQIVSQNNIYRNRNNITINGYEIPLSDVERDNKRPKQDISNEDRQIDLDIECDNENELSVTTPLKKKQVKVTIFDELSAAKKKAKKKLKRIIQNSEKIVNNRTRDNWLECGVNRTICNSSCWNTNKRYLAVHFTYPNFETQTATPSTRIHKEQEHPNRSFKCMSCTGIIDSYKDDYIIQNNGFGMHTNC